MAKTKDFDCVKMKEEIQAAMLKRHKDMTEDEIRADEVRRIKESPILGPIYADLTEPTRWNPESPLGGQ